MKATVFFKLPESNSHIELLNGRLTVNPVPIPLHQELVGNIGVLLQQITKILGGTVYIAPLDTYFDEDNVPQPDVMWIAPANLHIIGEKRLEGAPDLIIEVLSLSTAKNDKETKFRLYERYGVREYWIVDPVHQLVDV